MSDRSPAGESMSELVDESMSELVDESTVKMWLLVRADRWLLTGVVLLGSFLAFVALYFQWELINLSRALLYTSVPALVVMGTMITAVDAASVPGQTLGVDNLVLLTSFGFTVGITPFVVFIVYILRIVTVAKRTLAIGPFVLRETQRQGDTE